MHFLTMTIYAALVGVAFSLFMRDGVRQRARFAVVLALSMVGIAIAAGWLMYLVD